MLSCLLLPDTGLRLTFLGGPGLTPPPRGPQYPGKWVGGVLPHASRPPGLPAIAQLTPNPFYFPARWAITVHHPALAERTA